MGTKIKKTADSCSNRLKSTTTDVLSAEPVYKENKQHRSEIEQLGLLVKEKDDQDSEQIERSKARTMVLLRISAILILLIMFGGNNSSAPNTNVTTS
jgi:hypothetical protein